MGIYDRDYYRDESRRFSSIGQWSAVTTLIVINVAVFVADMFTPQLSEHWRWLDLHLALKSDLFAHPWNAWQLVTSGFVHSPDNIQHILFNMFGLWVFGRDVENVYGRKEFYRLYLSLVVLSGLCSVALDQLLRPHQPSAEFGASGAVAGIVIVYVLHFPNRMFLFLFFIPMPAWMIGTIGVVLDVAGFVAPTTIDPIYGAANVGHVAHLAGALFGFLYYRTGWTLASLWPGSWSLSTLKRWRGPKLRVHDESDDQDDVPLQQRVDRILEKISREGEASLTDAERRTLEEASRRYRRRG